MSNSDPRNAVYEENASLTCRKTRRGYEFKAFSTRFRNCLLFYDETLSFALSPFLYVSLHRKARNVISSPRRTKRGKQTADKGVKWGKIVSKMRRVIRRAIMMSFSALAALPFNSSADSFLHTLY